MSQREELNHRESKLVHSYLVGTPCYALYCCLRRDKQRRWVPAVVTKVFGSRSVNVRVLHGGPTWRHHIDQLRPRYGVEHDDDPGEALMSTSPIPDPKPQDGDGTASRPARRLEKRRNPRLPTPTDDHYGPDNPRRSKRLKQKTTEDEVDMENTCLGFERLSG
ncbi:hypothetical protein E2C01_009568 [Portunus trituberculatus]|uniref:Uncharacterized protein n=1 Tax=Portunus trituberculatus TaxID=210409 RepID=A0A5B7D656_PORTR|nr:hypothetical protein [Portunus trituberculatus]